MATYSEIQITFNADLATNSNVTFDILNVPTTLETTLFEKWVNTRVSSNQVTLGTPTATPGEISAINYITAFELDYNNTNLYVVSRVANVVTIKCTNQDISFQNGSALDSQDPPNILNVDFAYNNYNTSSFGFTDISYSQSTDPCGFVDVVVTTSELATEIVTPGIGVNTNNPFTVKITRATNGLVKVKNASGVEIETNFTTPPLLSVANVDVNIVSTPAQATVSITVNNSTGLILEYSIDDVTWQSSNIFNLVPGAYTVYIKDQYGCEINKAFNVDAFGIQTPYFYLSKSNSIRFANRIVWNNNGNHKTLDNSLSYEAEVDLPKMEIIQFQSNDVITTQFKSNYDTRTAKVINPDLSEDSISIVKKTENIGITNKRDARIISIASDTTKTGIYFGSGNLYDYDTGIDTGVDYALNGGVPEWGIEGNYIEFSGSWFLIEDVVFDEVRNVYLLIITNTYTGTDDATIIVSSLYNNENYEVYEFTIDFANYIDKQVSVRIDNVDANFDDLEHLSELIDARNTQEGTVEIRCKNETNTDILYSTGIEHKFRIPLNKKDAKPKSTLEAHDTDSSTILLNSQSREVFQYTFHPVTEQRMECLKQALLHETVIINGEYFVSTSPPEIEGAIGETNWYIVKALMTRSNSVYNSQNGGNGDFNSGNSDIPNLLQGSNGFIAY